MPTAEPASIMAGKRPRKSAVADTAAAAPSKSPMEESADALAGVEGALTGSKRKGTALTGTTPNKKIPKTSKSETSERPRSNSIEQLAEVAGSLLREDTAKKGASATSSAPAVATASTTVPDPMALAAMAAATAVSKTNNGTAAPTGFRKKGAAAKAAPTAAATAACAAAAAAAALNDEAALSSNDKGNKKIQIQYNPDIPMSKEQLTSWRREMRRVRNRESAAASRRKVRDRIEELEEEVAVWKKRYQEVTARLGKAEDEKKKKKVGKSEEGGDGKGDEVQV